MLKSLSANFKLKGIGVSSKAINFSNNDMNYFEIN